MFEKLIDLFSKAHITSAALIPSGTSAPERIVATCYVQADWMKNYTYNWPKWSPRNVNMSKKYGTCVTYVACVLQRLGYLNSGEYIWHTGKGYGTGKVTHANNKMVVTYMGNKTFSALKSKLKMGDIVLCDDNKSGEAGNGGHIMIFTGEWASNGNPYIWDQSCGKNGMKKRSYPKTHKILAIVRLKEQYMPKATKSIDTVAREVIANKWSSGDLRKAKLISAGYNYTAVQNRVNEILNPPKPTPTPTPTPTKKPYSGPYPVVKKYLEPGDKGENVKRLQNYLNWYTDGKFFKECGKADGVYGKNTLKYVKQMQTNMFGAKEADGLVGPKTIAKMKQVKK